MLVSRIENPVELMDLGFDRLMRRMWGGAEVPAFLAPYAVDIEEDADHIFVEAELPGFTKDEVSIALENGVLTIRAEHQALKKSKGRQALQTERHWTHFQRSFALPSAVKDDPVKAELVDGVLKITLERREETKPRKIHIGLGERREALTAKEKK